jgi:hypothetical protein
VSILGRTLEPQWCCVPWSSAPSKSLFGLRGKDKGDIILGTDALELYARLVIEEVDSLVWDIDSFSLRA